MKLIRNINRLAKNWGERRAGGEESTAGSSVLLSQPPPVGGEQPAARVLLPVSIGTCAIHGGFLEIRKYLEPLGQILYFLIYYIFFLFLFFSFFF
jgi:hypothetical protein